MRCRPLDVLEGTDAVVGGEHPLGELSDVLVTTAALVHGMGWRITSILREDAPSHRSGHAIDLAPLTRTNWSIDDAPRVIRHVRRALGDLNRFWSVYIEPTHVHMQIETPVRNAYAAHGHIQEVNLE